jgi:hypothetical protein
MTVPSLCPRKPDAGPFAAVLRQAGFAATALCYGTGSALIQMLVLLRLLEVL